MQKMVVTILAVMCFFGCSERTPPTPKTAAQIAEESRSEAEFQKVVEIIKAMKASAKNPASFELVDSVLMSSGSLCVTYRATNSFNAVVTESKAIKKDFKFGNWNKECGGKSGIDYDKARYAL